MENVSPVTGRRIIRRILIANNGGAAVKAIKSLKAWCLRSFADDSAIEIVGMATLEDEMANAEYISRCDYLARVPSGPNNHNYANVRLICEIAEEWDCDAVWPGWGHASENPELPEALSHTSKPVLWIGPPAASMQALGCKIGSSIIAQSVGVPVVPWSGSHIIIQPDIPSSNSGEAANPAAQTQSNEDSAHLQAVNSELRNSASPRLESAGTSSPIKHSGPDELGSTGNEIWRVTQEDKMRACIRNEEDLIKMVEEGTLSFPLMIKAASGGGGKGIRVVRHISAIPMAVHQVQQEVRGSLIFAMSLIENCRHLEVQIIADEYGNVCSLGARDCSIQRRHQKIIEEGPPTVAPEETLKAMERAAEQMCRAVGYTNAGTVEFLYDPLHDKFFFLEVNARLQVEHVVTEMLTDINLPAAQLQVSMGRRLDQMPDIANYLEKRNRPSIGHNADSRRSATHQRHCIAARVTAEDTENGFQPTSGEVHELSFESSPNVWAYFSIGSTSQIHQYADSQFGHIFATSTTRESARTALLLALRNLIVRGEISTNIEALQKILESREFIENTTWTTWLEQSLVFSSPLPARQLVGQSVLSAAIFAAVYKASKFFAEENDKFVTRLSQGQIPQPLALTYSTELVYREHTKFEVDCHLKGPQQIRVVLNGSFTDCRFNAVQSSSSSSTATDENKSTGTTVWYFISGGLDGKHRRVCFREDRKADNLRVTVNGATYLFTKERDQTQIRAPCSGKLVRWLVPNFGAVYRGMAYAEIEIMKMYVHLTCDDQGTLTRVLSEGAVFSTGDLLATLELPEGQTVPTLVTFEGKLPASVSGKRQCDSLQQLGQN